MLRLWGRTSAGDLGRRDSAPSSGDGVRRVNRDAKEPAGGQDPYNEGVDATSVQQMTVRQRS